MTARRAALRRYPALGFLAIAAALATMLPTALNVPTSGPSSLAELAPVPPDGSESDTDGDLSDLGSADSGGLGAGGGDGGSGVGPGGGPGGPPSLPPLDQRRPQGKRCVGAPPRQTEDPLSPPCVAYFDGDNGGATWRGVTRDEITVVVALPYNAAPPVDCAGELRGDEREVEYACKVYSRYFTDRYQTYGRRLHLWIYSGIAGTGTDRSQVVANIRARLADIDRERKPFAIVPADVDLSPTIAAEAARLGMMAVVHEGQRREEYRRVAPLLLSYQPDLEDRARTSADFVCRKLAGRAARYSNNVTDVGATRRFGLIYSDRPDRPDYAHLAALLDTELERTCGVRFAAKAVVNEAGDTSGAIGAMVAEQVTTVVPLVVLGQRLALLSAASGQGYRPEWFLAGDPDFDSAFNAANYDPTVWRGAFGITHDVRRGPLAAQAYAVAFKDACPSCTVPVGAAPVRIYENLTLLLYGIQAAGPRLRPETVDRGLHAIPQRGSPDPYRPAAYFAPGNYSFVKDGAAIWWDATGTAPTGGRPGCYHLPYDGARRRAGEWPAGDADIQAAGPCQGHRGRPSS